MYISQEIRDSIDATLKKEFGITYSEFEKLDENSQKEVLKNINAMLDAKIEESEEYLEKISIKK